MGAALCIAAALALAGCSGESPASEATSVSVAPTPTPTPTPEIVLWAGDVCVARDNLLTTLTDLATSLDYDPADSGSVGEQFQRQAEAQLDEITLASEAVGAALGGIPLDYVEAAAALSQLQAKVDALTAAKDEALGHVAAAQEAGNPLGAGAEWIQAAIAAKATFDAGQETWSALSSATDAADGDVGEAFATAPECR